MLRSGAHWRRTTQKEGGDKIGEGSLKLKQLNSLFLMHKTFLGMSVCGGEGGGFCDLINILKQSVLFYLHTVQFFLSYIYCIFELLLISDREIRMLIIPL